MSVVVQIIKFPMHNCYKHEDRLIKARTDMG